MLSNEAQVLSKLLISNDLTISVAESCTGGSLSRALTSIPGASSYFDCGYITYSNQSKTEMLGVDIQTIKTFGAVSEEVALEMVIGLATRSHSDIAVSVTGVAGPTGGTSEKPVGMVCFGFSYEGKTSTSTQLFSGDRASIVSQSVSYALKQLSVRF
jgi:nicotinamide-nucleotide amidase